MPDDEPKSAWELTLEKLKQKDAEEGRTAAPLTRAQKERIAAIRKEFEAKVAEQEILRQSRLRAAYAADDPAEELRKLEDGFQRDRRRLEDDRDAKIRKVREGAD